MQPMRKGFTGKCVRKKVEHFGIDLSAENAVTLDDGNAITSRHLNQMRRNINVATEGDDEDEDVGKGVPHHTGVGSSHQFPPNLIESFSKGMQSFHSAWGEKIQSMSKRLDGFEAQLTSQENEIRGLGDDVRGWFGQFSRSDD
ncbi:hypothetical protein PIB30_101714 [Stylosanthes scabra]|uniref:Uncharacterized protein n=1 Tax=Stylosanthes scabra TaxID=79078 RepID=A0ABU6WX48_9FABA|nr:hypothetical protein [Stylosanthes scabra]